MTHSAWQGELHLDYGYQDGQTQLRRSRQQAPLKVQRSFYPEGQAVCHTVMLHTAGGLVGGDRLHIEVNLQAGAQVFMTTAAASKVYRSIGLVASQTVCMQVASGGCLEWFPQEAIAFCGAKYNATMRVDLAAGARFVGWEITRFGRTARGESFTTGNWRSRLEIWQENCLSWSDRQWLPGEKSVINSPHGLKGYPVVGTLIWCGIPVPHTQFLALRNYGAPVEGEGGMTTLPDDGILCRYRGHSTTTVRHWFATLWQHLRRTQLQRDPVKLRIWH